MAGRSKHAAPHRRKKNRKGLSIGTVVSLLVCLLCFSAAFFLWKAALAGPKLNREAGEEEDFRPVVGDPPLKNTVIDSGHSGYGTELSDIMRAMEDQTRARRAL